MMLFGRSHYTYLVLVLALALAAVLTGCDFGGGGPGSSGPFNL